MKTTETIEEATEFVSEFVTVGEIVCGLCSGIFPPEAKPLGEWAVPRNSNRAGWLCGFCARRVERSHVADEFVSEFESAASEPPSAPPPAPRKTGRPRHGMQIA